MAWALVQGTTFPGVATSTATIPLTAFGAAVGSGNTVNGFASWDSSGAVDVTSVTDNQSNTYTVTTNVNDAVQGQRCITFSLGNITNGPTTITVNLNGNAAFRSAIAEEFSGADASANNRDGATGQNQAAPGTGTDAITSGAITTTVAGDLIWGVTARLESTTLPTVGTGFTIGTSENGVQGNLSEYLTQGAAGSVAATFTQGTASRCTTSVIAIKPAAGGGGGGGQTLFAQACL